MHTLPNGQKPPGCPPWWPFGTVAEPPTLAQLERESRNQLPPALL